MLPLTHLLPHGLTVAAFVAPAQDVEIEVRVLSVRGNVVDIDRGASAGAAPGDIVVLRPLGQPEITGTVRSVSSTIATVVLSNAASSLGPGVPGVLRVPVARLAAPRAPEVPGMPPAVWTSQEGPWEEGVPLLAEVRAPAPEERPTVWHGRGTLGLYGLRDSGALARDDSVGRVGLFLEGQNPFGRGGRLRAAGEVRSQRTVFEDSALRDDSETFLRVDELSYSWGGTRDAARSYEVGRFLSRAFPELGLLDGGEVAHRFDNGVRIGGSLASIAALDRERSFEDAPQVALWALAPFGENRRGELGVALQETWFEGAKDRDLLLTRARWTDGEAWSADAVAWTDLYRSDDAGKSPGLELTEARASVTRSSDGAQGVRVDLGHVGFPSLRRLRAQDIAFEELDRAGAEAASLSFWTPFGERGRWNARIGGWSDRDDDGVWADLGYDHRFAVDGLDLGSVALFFADNPQRDVLGGRTRVSGPGLGGRWSLGVDLGIYQRLATDGTAEDLLQGALRAGWNGAFGADWYLYFDGAARFGDEQDALSFDITLQRSF